MIRTHTQPALLNRWCAQVQGHAPALVCVLGFTETALIPGISAAGATPCSRRLTAAADAEFLINGPSAQPVYPLPPLAAGVSPVYISRAIVQALDVPVVLVTTGLPVPLPVPAIALGPVLARCVSTGNAMDRATVHHLWRQGWDTGKMLLQSLQRHYYIIGECVVGGTTTALAVLTGLGWSAQGCVSSSHPRCNHAQKWQVVQAGLAQCRERLSDPWAVVAALGDPMQVVVAAMTLAMHQEALILLAGGTQMLAVWALIQALADDIPLPWRPEQVAVGTTGWVVNDPSAQVVGLARDVGAPLMTADLNFQASCYPALRAYEQGFVKEGVAAGGCAIAAHLYRGWTSTQVLAAVEALLRASATPSSPTG
ncbi:MAG: TIGR00303 family protein [Gloeomargarita sp. SKYB31]|nr:TIGR00303 family protein [Gloeomargarita sp. SKYB31]